MLAGIRGACGVPVGGGRVSAETGGRGLGQKGTSCGRRSGRSTTTPSALFEATTRRTCRACGRTGFGRAGERLEESARRRGAVRAGRAAARYRGTAAYSRYSAACGAATRMHSRGTSRTGGSVQAGRSVATGLLQPRQRSVPRTDGRGHAALALLAGRVEPSPPTHEEWRKGDVPCRPTREWPASPPPAPDRGSDRCRPSVARNHAVRLPRPRPPRNGSPTR